MRVAFADGSSGDYDLVVGADGIGSTVRRLAVSDVAPTRTPTVGWRGVIAGRPVGVDHLVLLLGEARFLGLVLVGGGDTYGFAGTGAGDEPFPERFAGFGGPVPDFLARLDDATAPHVAPIGCVTLDRWHEGRVVLIGDAAHATHPHMGQGGSLAVEDALVLADELDPRRRPSRRSARPRPAPPSPRGLGPRAEPPRRSRLDAPRGRP